MIGTGGTFTIGDSTYTVVDVDTYSFREQRIAKRASRGMTTGEMSEALLQMDQDAWFAVLLVSMLRADPNADEGALEEANFVEVMTPIVEAALEKEPPGPPPSAAAAPSEEPAATTTPEEPGVL